MKIKNSSGITLGFLRKVEYKFEVGNSKKFEPLIWSTNSKLPPSLKLTKKGLLKGKITEDKGPYKIKIKVVNNKNQSVSKVFFIQILLS